jgi:CDP-glucose 4,6-dehydratase
MAAEFWNGKRVLVTGHTGFKGSWLSLWLQMRGARLTGIALPPPTTPSLFEIAEVAKGMESIVGDIRNYDLLHRTVKTFNPEIVIHMAAQSVVTRSYEEPVYTFETNVMGTVHVLEAIRQAGKVRSVVIVTSDKCYENHEWQWGYREIDRLGGHEPYSLSKAAAEMAAAAYRNSYFQPSEYTRHGVAMATSRAGNVIGGGDWTPNQLVPDVMRAFADRRPVVLKKPYATRPWQFVLEPLNGYLALAEKQWVDGCLSASAFNFGPPSDRSQTVQWIVERLAERWGEGAGWTRETAPQPHEAGYLKLDSSLAQSVLGWQPKLGLETTLDWTAEWYRAYYQQDDMRALTMEHVRRFEKRP